MYRRSLGLRCGSLQLLATSVRRGRRSLEWLGEVTLALTRDDELKNLAAHRCENFAMVSSVNEQLFACYVIWPH